MSFLTGFLKLVLEIIHILLLDKIYKSSPSHTTLMECEKCKTQLDEQSKFCEQCGKKVEKSFSEVDSLVKNCRRFWFMVGVYRGICLCQGDDESLKKFEDLLKEADSFEDYNEAVVFLENKLNLPLRNEIK